jgi:hypothetical protein
MGKAYPMLALRSAATWTFIMGGVHTRVLTAPRPIKPASPRRHSAWQPNPGRGSTHPRVGFFTMLLTRGGS